MSYGSSSGASVAPFDLRIIRAMQSSPPAARRLSAWQTTRPMSYRSNSAASDVDLARFDLRIIRPMQSSGRPRHDG